MFVSVLDSRIFRNTFGTQAIRDIFSDEAYVKNLIEVEAALARAESKTGVIPAEVGPSLTKSLARVQIDFGRLARETDVVGYPVLPLIRQLAEQSPTDTAKYIHWGATTQDIMDNAVMLQIRSGIRLVRQEMLQFVRCLADLAKQHRDTPMAGRTHLQHALPVTFGYKCAVYLFPFLQHIDRLKNVEQNNLLVQFGGAAGTLASLGRNPQTGLRVRAALARELDLLEPPITWHVARDTIAEILNLLALIGGSLGKIAYDLIIMSSNEFGEVSEPFVPHRGASSTMPQKRNPISSEIILAASKLLREKASLGLDAMVADFERQSGPWHLEWAAVPDAFTIAVGALHQANFALGGLVVNKDAMLRNLLSSKGLVVGEAVMMGLAPHIGRGEAHDVVYDACKTAIESDKALFDVLAANNDIISKVSADELNGFCDPLNYLGASQLQVDEVTKLAAQYVAT
ncbi:hypothetical protein LTR64_006457 [Lithohypha guttulata]|uniref:Adenylosuccinate lyase C-terminal domain-containing protein n=1 Tax=Lithohypha guttulata TaxID=1690604 RepID=A0AAN7YFJ3_9EURO|nr:hypothetical protein LTR51_004986 [Lithohypha guttulata]KAK5091592.1 hypothetical protein LTR05_001777 [Lithohypha guttulata]